MLRAQPFACDPLRLYTRFHDLPEHNRMPLQYPHRIAVSTNTSTAAAMSLALPFPERHGF